MHISLTPPFLTKSAYVILISHKYMSTLLETLDQVGLNIGWTMLIPASFDEDGLVDDCIYTCDTTRKQVNWIIYISKFEWQTFFFNEILSTPDLID